MFDSQVCYPKLFAPIPQFMKHQAHYVQINLTMLGVMITAGERQYNPKAINWYGADVYIANSYRYCREPTSSIFNFSYVYDTINSKGSKAWYKTLERKPGWWCANRGFLDHVKDFYFMYPHKRFYLFIDNDTVVFARQLYFMLQNIVALQIDKVYMGHTLRRVTSLAKSKYFVATGGGALVLTKHVRDVVFNGMLEKTRRHAQNGKYSWWAMDWLLAELLKSIHVNPIRHRGFQQFVGRTWCKCKCPDHAITCHPFANQTMWQAMLDYHNELSFSMEVYNACTSAEVINWKCVSRCKEDL